MNNINFCNISINQISNKSFKSIEYSMKKNLENCLAIQRLHKIDKENKQYKIIYQRNQFIQKNRT